MAATGIESTIAELLFAKLEAFHSVSPPYPVAYPNLSFTTPEDGKYLEAQFMPNKTANISLSNSGSDQHQGLLQVSVHWSREEGIIKPGNVASELIAFFPRDMPLAGNGVKITISGTPWQAKPMDMPDGLVIPVTIPWRAFIRH